MSTRTLTLDDDLYRYLIDVSVRETPIQRRLREETAKLEMARMQIAPEQGQFMALLVMLMGARKTLEVGVFTGYSTLCVAAALPDEGQVIACDVSDEWTSVARRYWKEAGLDGKIDLRLAPAAETLDSLIEKGEKGQFDFAFIDADKENYARYYEQCLQLVRPGGLIAVDNTLWSGSVIDSDDQSNETNSIRELNEALRKDSRIRLSLVPIGDGLTLALKLRAVSQSR
ncbi:MAG TPA: class I SAM-dependent methyltransferase [Alphaproteobacteria bacterium]|nr:class I SAM-dependent methyltransferase [Alphaproteobacteria bacterium]